MGIFSRISDIVNANINAMLDKAENPEKMVKLMISEMEDTLIEVKSSAAEVVAERIRLERQLKEQQARAFEWANKTELALDKGRDDLARAALEQKVEAEKIADTLENRLAEVREINIRYQDDIARLEEKLNNARNRQKVMIAQHQSAQNRRRVEDQIYRINTTGAFAKFESYQKRIDRLNAEAEIVASSNTQLDKEFHELSYSNKVEEELAALKAKRTTPKTPTPNSSVSA